MTFETTLVTTDKPPQYLGIGHVTRDLTPDGPVLGGTVSYAALTAAAMGLKVGIATSYSGDFEPKALREIMKRVIPAKETTTFENINTPNGRVQRIHHLASPIHANTIPIPWRNCPIVHLGPVTNEIEAGIAEIFPNAMIGITPQGWMRRWDDQGNVYYKQWEDAAKMLKFASAVVLSIEDVQHDENEIERLVEMSRILIVTEGAEGARVYWNGDVRKIRPPKVTEVDATGAGDIFATAFFIRYSQTRDPWTAAEFATKIACQSVTRTGMSGIPTPSEAQKHLIEIL